MNQRSSHLKRLTGLVGRWANLLVWLGFGGAVLLGQAGGPPWVRSTSAVDVFTNLSTRLLAADGHPFGAGNIPVYTNGTFAFSPDVHRVLQVAANIYDASTNRTDRGGPDAPFLPSVFRPTFAVATNGDIFINNWLEVTNAGDAELAQPLDLNEPDELAQVRAAGFFSGNLYDVPWIIGAKKGFPNFNEFALQSVAQITRRLQLRRLTPLTRPMATNQMFLVGISNILGVELWHPYVSNYSRAVQVIVADDLTITLSATNDATFDFRGTQQVSRMTIGGVTNLEAGTWPGTGNDLINGTRLRLSFVIPLLTNLVVLQDSIYRTDSGPTPYFTTQTNSGVNLLDGFEQTGRFPLPQFQLAVTNRIRVLLIDTDTQRVIDCVQLGGLMSLRNLSEELGDQTIFPVDSTEAALWATNRVGGDSISNAPAGVINQLQAGLGNINIVNWNSYGIAQPSGQTKQKAIDSFRVFCRLTPIYFPNTVNTNLIVTAPFTPTRKTSLYQTWQANDPFVHFQRADLQSITGSWGLRRESPNGPVLAVPNLGSLNNRFEPWGGNPSSSQSLGIVPPYDLTVKDPLIRSAENWQFGEPAPLAVAWLGRVHRGTPWQTLYLKAANVSPTTWQQWLGLWDAETAQRARPVTDRALINSLVALLNTNTPATLLSLNTSDNNAWRQAFDGLTAITNTATEAELNYSPPAPRFETNLMTAASPQAAVLADAILQARAGVEWQAVTDVLRTPALTEDSPWLNQSSAAQLQYGLSDEAYETLAAQLLPRLRPDSIGAVRSRPTGLVLTFTGCDAFFYVVEASEDLAHWSSLSTNSPENGVIELPLPEVRDLPRRFYRSRLLP
ncbi:MAG TPA: hypothetical protein VFV96_06880 [Verrucomicrobiae bacterium]|nr:hypothetical protein [Verrucomicrobiae bacterium]